MGIENSRADFPVLERLIDGQSITYLDSAATSLKPRSVIDAMSNYYYQNGVNIHRGKYYLSEEASDSYERVRYSIAQYLGAYGNEIVFTKGTTEALNLVAYGLDLQKEDTVVGFLDSHHAQMLPWRRYANLKLVHLNEEGGIDLEHYRELLKLKPKVVVLTHCSNVSGTVAPIEQMAIEAKEACGAIVVVDAAQSIPHPHLRIDVSKLSVDFVAFSGHKMLGPTGVGCLYGKSSELDKLRPLMLGGGMVDWVDTEGSQERKIPHRFEAGTPPIASTLGLGAALSYLNRFSAQESREHTELLTEAIIKGAMDRDYIELLGSKSAKDRCAIGSLRIRGCDDLSDIARSLSDSYGIMCRTGHMCAQPVVDNQMGGEILRISAYIYNTPDEIEKFYLALDELVSFLGL
ncbi:MULTISPECIES: aminotransferase class V-fold PLP-dependent enzyme [Pseudoalteromonas]|uniref:aminotransferase class V-fold PLP-dependent enzyme n=1 Tax=Pseudoalteromonas TaxID=53246 RepID=UPI0003076B43|nr:MULTISPECIES: aminotransferase class V-fold PLP-dependent enzyme [Pseudoalteromonas]MDP4489527.1 aminotransferase class V-fold PLP-dependent enzyme [Pseudoalteromonas piscicida]